MLMALQAYQSYGLCEWMEHIQRQHWRTMDMTLERVSEVWRRLNVTVPGFKVAIAGTNGKGSTVAMLEAVALHGGNATGAYTSPHLIRFNERIRINGIEASDAEICAAFTKIEQARADIPLTYFEFGTLCALLLFQQHNVALCLMEVGLGGRLDAVNMIDNDMSIITQVGIDHASWLGNDRETIALEKSGIIRKNTVVVCSDADTPAAIIQTAQARAATLFALNRDFSYAVSAGEMTWIAEPPLELSAAKLSEWNQIKGLRMPLRGEHQLNNLAGVISAVSQFPQSLNITTQTLKAGLSKVKLLGRCQIMDENPQVVLDVAHNPDSSAELSKFLQSNPVNGKTLGVFAALCDKDVDGITAPLQRCIDTWYLAGLDEDRGQSAEQLAGKLTANLHDKKPKLFETPLSAWSAAFKDANAADRIVIFGSFHTVGDILAAQF